MAVSLMKKPMPQPVPPALAFDAATHTYALNGQRVLSVTQILEAVGLVDDDYFTEDSRTRGRYVHRMVLYSEREGLDENTVDERLRGYLEAYRRFVQEVAVGPCTLLERPLCDPILRFAGTPDQLRPMQGRETLIDLKSGQPHPTHGLQLAAYEHLIWRQLRCGRLDRAAVYLKPNGSYRLRMYEDRNDWKIFDCARVLAQWKAAG